MSDSSNKEKIKELTEVGAYFGSSRSRRHPSLKGYIFGIKNNVDILDIDKTISSLEKALEFVKKLSKEGKTLMFVGNKNEAQKIIEEAAKKAKMPYVAERWIGGTLTNFDEIKKRIERLAEIREQERSGELKKYTKKERAGIAEEAAKLERYFGGIAEIKELPSALFLVDSRKESTALREAEKMNIPVIALCGSDNDIGKVDYPIIGNDKTVKSIKYFVEAVTEAYNDGKK